MILRRVVAFALFGCLLAPAFLRAQTLVDTLDVIYAAFLPVDTAAGDLPPEIEEFCVIPHANGLRPEGLLEGRRLDPPMLGQAVADSASRVLAARFGLRVTPGCGPQRFDLIAPRHMAALTTTGIHFQTPDSAAVGVWYYPDHYRDYGFHCWFLRSEDGVWRPPPDCVVWRGMK